MYMWFSYKKNQTVLAAIIVLAIFEAYMVL